MSFVGGSSLQPVVREMLARIDQFIFDHEGKITRFVYKFSPSQKGLWNGAVRVSMVSVDGERFDYLGPFYPEEFALLQTEIEDRRPISA